jgi:plasmid maintenance system antidote protein VapI
MSNSSITQRFLECLDRLVADGKIRSKRHFALTLGYHAQGVSEMVANRRDVPLELIEKAVKAFRFNPIYLFTGQGNLFCNPAEDDGLRLRNLTVVLDPKGDERILHIPYPAQAGYVRSLNDPVFLSDLPTYQLPGSQFRSGTYRSFEIAGSSMEPVFMPGDIVIASFIEPKYWEQAMKQGQIYIIVTQQDIVIKRINNFLKSLGHLECCSDNTDFETYTIDAIDILEVWKPSLKLTKYIEQTLSRLNTTSITEQLQVQQRMLENLQQHLTNVKVS